MPRCYKTLISRAVRTLTLALLMMACIFMKWHAERAYGQMPKQQSNAGAIAQGESRDTDSMEQAQSPSQRIGRDVERAEYSDRESEAPSAGSSQRSLPGEFYGAVFGGYTIAHGIDIEGTGLGSFVNLGTIRLKDSGVYGGKAGFFFPGRANWAGVEVEAFRTTPDVKGTTIDSTVGGFPIPMAGGRIPGAQLSVTTVALNAVARAKFMCQPDTGADDSISVRQERRPLCAL